MCIQDRKSEILRSFQGFQSILIIIIDSKDSSYIGVLHFFSPFQMNRLKIIQHNS